MSTSSVMLQQMLVLFDCLNEIQQAELIKIARTLMVDGGEWAATQPALLWPLVNSM